MRGKLTQLKSMNDKSAKPDVLTVSVWLRMTAGVIGEGLERGNGMRPDEHNMDCLAAWLGAV